MTSKFPLEKILKNVKLETYLESVGKEVSDYDLWGVVGEGITIGQITNGFAYKVPSNAEVVVEYHIEYYGEKNSQVMTQANAYGLALIPKNPRI